MVKTLEVKAWQAIDSAWNRACWKLPMLQVEVKPYAKLNGRLKTTAGRAWLEYNFIDLSTELFLQHQEAFCAIIIPHEVAHIVAYRLYNDPGHGTAWKKIMREVYGLPADVYHSLRNEKYLSRKGK